MTVYHLFSPDQVRERASKRDLVGPAEEGWSLARLHVHLGRVIDRALPAQECRRDWRPTGIFRAASSGGRVGARQPAYDPVLIVDTKYRPVLLAIIIAHGDGGELPRSHHLVAGLALAAVWNHDLIVDRLRPFGSFEFSSRLFFDHACPTWLGIRSCFRRTNLCRNCSCSAAAPRSYSFLEIRTRPPALPWSGSLRASEDGLRSCPAVYDCVLVRLWYGSWTRASQESTRPA